jgi:hypothetical protein
MVLDHNQQLDIIATQATYNKGPPFFKKGHLLLINRANSTALSAIYHTVGEKELISIVETLKQFRTMLYGCPNIHV